MEVEIGEKASDSACKANREPVGGQLWIVQAETFVQINSKIMQQLTLNQVTTQFTAITPNRTMLLAASMEQLKSGSGKVLSMERLLELKVLIILISLAALKS